MSPDSRIAYYPRILRSLVEISAFMGVGVETIKDWISKGAPVAVELDGRRPRFSAEAAALQEWRLRESRKE